MTLRDDLEFVAGLGIATAMGGSEVAPGSNPRGHQKGQGQETGGLTICAIPVVTAIPVQNRTVSSA